MICPKCKQKTNHVINTKFFDEFNYLERERECRHPNRYMILFFDAVPWSFVCYTLKIKSEDH